MHIVHGFITQFVQDVDVKVVFIYSAPRRPSPYLEHALATSRNKIEYKV